MQYKTVILELIQQQPTLHEQLRRDRLLLSTLEWLARDLKARHDDFSRIFSQVDSTMDQKRALSAASELAMQEMKDRLAADSLTQPAEPLSLDRAMEFLRRRSSQG